VDIATPDWNRPTLEEAQQVIAANAANADYYRQYYMQWEKMWLPQMVEWLSLIDPGHCIDVGPGNGTLAYWLRQMGWHVYLLDNVPLGTFITPEFAQREGLHYYHCSIETDPELPEIAPVDVMVMGQVIGHLKYNPQPTIARLARQYLKPDGLFFFYNLDCERTSGSYAYESWRVMPEPGSAPPVADMNTCRTTLADYREMMESIFESTEVFAYEGAPILYAICEMPKG